MHFFCIVCLVATLGLTLPAKAEKTQHPPPQDVQLHEKFYSTWYMPDNPAKSCCNKSDCYPTEIKYVGTSLLARRRESYMGFWVTRRSGGVVCRHFDDLDAVFESDTCDDLRQLICAFQPAPGLRCGAEQLEHHQLGSR